MVSDLHEPYAVKAACTVPRGAVGRKANRLPYLLLAIVEQRIEGLLRLTQKLPTQFLTGGF